jgi:hypothetical protein
MKVSWARLCIIIAIGVAVGLLIYYFPQIRIARSISGNGYISRITYANHVYSFSDKITAEDIGLKYQVEYAYIHGDSMVINYLNGVTVNCRAVTVDDLIKFVPEDMRGGGVTCSISAGSLNKKGIGLTNR